MRLFRSLKLRGTAPKRALWSLYRPRLEPLEDRVVPSLPDGTLLVATGPSPFSSVDQSSFPAGLVALNPSTGEQSVLFTGNLFTAPTYITQAPNQQLYITDIQAFGTGAIIQVDLNTGAQKLVARGGFINGPNVLTYLNGFLYVANEGDASGTIHNIVRIDPNTGDQHLIADGSNGVGFSIPTGMALAPGHNVYVADEPGNVQGVDPGKIWEVNLDTGQQTIVSSNNDTQGRLFNHPVDVAVDASGNLIIVNTGSDADSYSGSVLRVDAQTGRQTLLSSFAANSGVDGVDVGADGTIWVGTISNGSTPGRIYAVDPVTGAQRILSSGGALSEVEGIRVFRTLAAAATTTVSSSTNASVFGQLVTFTASVSAQASNMGTPTGTVQFQIDGSNFGGPVSLATLGGATTASVSTTALSVGTHTVTAIYSGDSTFPNGSGSLAGGQTVNQAGTSMVVTSSANPVVSGQTVTFTATISVQPPGAGTPTGTVQFQVDGSNVGTPVSFNIAGGPTTVTFSIASLAAGAHTITARYSGDASFAGSTASLAGGQTVSNPSNTVTTTTISSRANPSVFGQPVTFTATVSVPGIGTPTGTVQFQIDGSNVGSPVSVSTIGGITTASFSTATLSAGGHIVIASYSGDGSFAASVGTLTNGQMVNKADTSMVVSSSLNPSVLGQTVSFTATINVAAPGAGTPTGTVQFQIDGSNVGSPVTVSTSGGVTAASFSSAGLAAGTHTITANYSGDGSFTSSASTLSGGQLVKSSVSGNVTARRDPSTRLLSITGDAGNNVITITQVSDGVLQVAGSDTTVNQSSNPVMFSSVTGITVSFLNGNDSVTMTRFSIPGTLSITAGTGSDAITLTGVAANLISITTVGSGKDIIALNTTTSGEARISAGDNATLLMNAANSDSVTLSAGNYATVSVNGVLVTNDLAITVGDNAQSITMKASSAANLNILQNGLTGNPLFDLEYDTIAANLNLSAGAGNNKVVLSNIAVVAQLSVFLGAGKNTVNADHVTALFGIIDGGLGGNNTYFDGGGNSGFVAYHFLGH